jgi:hypothetical protein
MDIATGCYGWLRPRVLSGFVVLILVYVALSAGCGTTLETAATRYETLQEGDITIHVPVNEAPDTGSIQSFFNNNIVMIGPVRADSTAESDMYWLDYPSINTGPGPLYSHRVRIIVSPGFPLAVEDLVSKDVRAILVPVDGPDTWKLVGRLSTSSDRGPFDWFAGHPELQFKP